MILVFPKKGKPKAAGSTFKKAALKCQDMSPGAVNPEVILSNDEDDDRNNDEDYVCESNKNQDYERGDDSEDFNSQASQSLPRAQLPPEISDDYQPQAGEPNIYDKKYVVRCTLGGCYKYYHVTCVYQNKNVSCINSMKVQRFRCPLHYCDICMASGDSVLIVQCVECPTAYHVKCIPRGDPLAIKLTKKFIICKKHNRNAEDFPKYEEKQVSSAPQATPYLGLD